MNSARLGSFMVLSLLAACSGSRATPVATPVATTSADAATVADASVAVVDAAPPADPRREALMAAWRATTPTDQVEPTIVAGPIDYPDPEAQGTRIAAVLGHGHDAVLFVTSVPYAAERTANQSLSYEGEPSEVIAGLAVRDINRDHKPDVAVFLRTEHVLDEYLPLNAFMEPLTFVAAPEPHLASLERANVQLLGVRDEAGLDAAIATLDTYEPPTDGMSPLRFISRLRFATPAQFRAAVASTGLRLCTDFPDRTGNRRKRCQTLPAARLTDAMITGRIRRDLGDWVDVLSDDVNQLQGGSCQRHGREISCGANVGGPAGNGWSLIGEGASMRLIEIAPWYESS